MLHLKKEHQNSFNALSKLILKLVQLLPEQGIKVTPDNLQKHIKVYETFHKNLYSKLDLDHYSKRSIVRSTISNLIHANILVYRSRADIFKLRDSNLLEEAPNK